MWDSSLILLLWHSESLSCLKIALSWGRRDVGAGLCLLLRWVSLCLPLSCSEASSCRALCCDCVCSWTGSASSPPPGYMMRLAQQGCELSHPVLEKQQNNSSSHQCLPNHCCICLTSASICSWGLLSLDQHHCCASTHPATAALLLSVLRG